MTTFLEVTDLGVDFPVRGPVFGAPQLLRAVDGVSFGVARGEIVGVVGESGSGKTTLGRAILRLVEPTRGAVRFDGVDMAGLGSGAMLPIRRRLQAVFQDPAGSLNPAMTVGSAIAEGLAIHGIGTRADRAGRIAALLERVGLTADTAPKRPHMLSGGQRQRVGIARALAVAPELIVADEAVSALDVSVQAQIVNLLADLRDELGLAMLFIAHDLGLVDHLCDRVIVLYLGRVMEMGRTAAVFAAPRHPYTRALLAAVPSLDPGRRAAVTLSGELPSPISPPSGCVFRTRCPHAIAACADVVPALAGEGDHVAACIRTAEIG